MAERRVAIHAFSLPDRCRRGCDRNREALVHLPAQTATSDVRAGVPELNRCRPESALCRQDAEACKMKMAPKGTNRQPSSGPRLPTNTSADHCHGQVALRPRPASTARRAARRPPVPRFKPPKWTVRCRSQPPRQLPLRRKRLRRPPTPPSLLKPFVAALRPSTSPHSAPRLRPPSTAPRRGL